MKKQKTDFRLTGLSREKSATCELLNSDKEIFWPTVGMSQDRFNALWDFCKDDWSNKKIAEIEHDGIDKDGLPINGVLVNIRMWDLN